ncbi:phospholipase D-like domain-containing protein [Mangrovimonas sp. AS39]|uniref:phospholipase D-like domain-containing protein n=1 Tax=Mangrovimonas futianensis TaxID=2895523 RepID=UPI001E50F7C2|nr:phospholipase D-like domain-containing protein [Mangrovimonas futianensis]MCF1190108.1 phospholipase D-like domain-containing protein [Mangrovimonas futianensis]MCF1194141.1 phospholipase D-like domain-containing protein [Mangrovimonas futianensis]
MFKSILFPKTTCHFSNIQFEIVSKIKQAEKSLKISVTWFTNHTIFNTILDLIEKKKIDVKLVVLNDGINNGQNGVNFKKFIQLGGTLIFSDEKSMVHNKFCIIDEKILINGSYNYTYYAETRNWENITISNSKRLVKSYVKEFNKIVENHKPVKNIDSEKSFLINYLRPDFLITDSYLYAQNLKVKDQSKSLRVLDQIIVYMYENASVKKITYNYIKEERSNIFREVIKDPNLIPFEIGIDFANGYTTLIPAYTAPPFEYNTKGLTFNPNQVAGKIKLYKIEPYVKTEIKTIDFQFKETPLKGTPKIDIYLYLNKNRSLKIKLQEINGSNLYDDEIKI